MDMDKIRTQEALCAELIKAAKQEASLIGLDEAQELDSDRQVAIWACVSVTQQLQLQLINAITSD